MTSQALLPPERAGHPPAPDLARSREAAKEAIAEGMWRTDPAAEERVIAGVRVLCFPPPGPPRATLVHLHGGGFRQGCPEMIGPYAIALARSCGVEVLCPAYRLAPEYPFPAGLSDAHKVYAAWRENGALPVILAGDSAGAGLAASLTALCVAERLPPAGLITLSPWLDLTVSSGSYADNAANDPLFSREAAMAAAALYLQGASPDHPLASPLFGALEGFPPSFIAVGRGEVLLADSRQFAASLRAAGAQCSLLEIDGMHHVAVTRSLGLHGSEETFRAVVGFVDRLLG